MKINNKVVCALGILGCVVLLGVLIVHLVRGFSEVEELENEGTTGGKPVATGIVERTSTATLPVVPKTNAAPVIAVTKPATGRTPVAPTMTNAAPVASVNTNVPAARQVRLANRTIGLEKGRRKFPAKFAELQTPSARGTVAFVVVSELPVSKLVRDRASACGARVIGFMPVNSLIVEASAKTLKRLEDDAFFAAAYELDPSDKIQTRVREKVAAQPKHVDVTVVPLMATDVGLLETFVKGKGGAVIPESNTRGRLVARVPATVVEDLARRGDVRWIESYTPATLQNDVAVNPGLMNVRVVWDTHGLTGRGQNITTTDSGVDTGDLSTLMADFTGRVYGIGTVRLENTLCNTTDANGHGTHTAGSLVGNGALSEGQIRGVAHGSRLYVWQGLYNGSLYAPPWEMFFQPDEANFPAYIASASWGYEATASYTVYCADVDEYVWRHPENLGVFAAGNNGAVKTIMDPAGAKNVLAVGASESLRSAGVYAAYTDNPSERAAFSSQGPMKDGRIKPDICAPGTMILSTRTTQVPQGKTVGWASYAANSNYTYNSGTSMSTPLVAGAAALVREWLVERRGFTNALPTAALVKAILMGGARDLSDLPDSDCGGAAPNNQQGWGCVDLGETLYPSNRAVRVFDRIPFSGGSEIEFHVAVTNQAPLDVQLVWVDYPASPNARSTLINDLDLVVSNETTGVVWWGNGVDGGDRVNTVERVRIGGAAPATYSIRVRVVAVPYDSTEGGAAAVYVRGAFEGEEEASFEEGPEPEVFPLRYRSQFPRLEDWGTTCEVMIPSGQVVQVKIPENLPDGAEFLTGWALTDDVTGGTVALEEQRLAEVVRATHDASEGERLLDGQGRMPQSFEVKVETPTDLLFRYYGISETNATVGLPDWWYRRYLAGATEGTDLGRAEADADGDGVSNADEYAADTDPTDPASVFQIVSFSPTNLVWRGGRERTQVVERADTLGPGAVWRGIFTNLPPTAREVQWAPPKALTNSFYRIRAF